MPMRARQVSAALALAMLLTLLAQVVWGLKVRWEYASAFDQTAGGESLEVVQQRFGPPSHIESGKPELRGYDDGSRSVCGGSCWLRFWYEPPFTLGIDPYVVDFDQQQRVIHKARFHSP